ncbi:MAG: DeoR/GlpR family DNA-binding transcription regulator [Treponema sp.]|nr:DeoR/GlpR family DNA-binding transcription regulator [Treponema sp.]
MNKKNQRMNRLISNLRIRKTAMVRDLAEEMGVSDMTVRRDLNELVNNHIVERSHGRAIFIQDDSAPVFENIESIYNLSYASNIMSEEKRRIAKYAATLVEPNEVIIIDNGSTTDKVPDYLPMDMQMTVVCYNLNIIIKLYKNDKIKLILAGGYFHPSDQIFESAESMLLLKSIRANKLFISASGVHQTLGMTCAHTFEVLIKQTVLESSLKKILLADSGKFGAVKTVFFSSIDKLDMIITDTGLSPEWVEFIRNMGIELVMV